MKGKKIMDIVGKIGNYILYKIDDSDVDINSAAGSRYIRNSVLVFSIKETELKCGNEIKACNSLEEAKRFIVENTSRQSIREMFQVAKERADKEVANKNTLIRKQENERQPF